MGKVTGYALIVSSLAALVAATAPAVHAFKVTQITNNDTIDMHPAIFGSNVVREHCDGASTAYVPQNITL